MRKGPSRPPYVLALALGIAALGGALVTGTLVASTRAQARAEALPRAPQQYVVAIMPGHGGVDPGAISPFNGLEEKDVTLSVGLDLRRDLEALGVKVVMTRTSDVDVSISAAEKRAVAGKARVLLSLWVNDWTTASLEGATVFTPHQSDASLARPLSHALGDAIAASGMGDRGVEMLPQLWVRAPMPAVTIEVGFMSNQQDSELLAEPSFRATVASGLAHGMLAYAPQIRRIETRLVAYRRVLARVEAQRHQLALDQQLTQQLLGWTPGLLLADALLLFALYSRSLVAWMGRRVPRLATVAILTLNVLGRGLGKVLDALWARITGPRRRDHPGGGAAPGRSPSRSRGPRRPPRQWRGREASLHPRRVTEMVQPGDRAGSRARRSIYDDFAS